VIGVWKILAEPPLACTIAGDREFFLQNLPLEIPRGLGEIARIGNLNLLLLLLLGSLKGRGNLARELGKRGKGNCSLEEGGHL
jgi:hypothetical protein